MRRLAGIQVYDGTVQSQRSLPRRARGRLRRKTRKESRRARPPCSQPHRSSTDPRDGGANSLCDRLGAVWIEATGVQCSAAPLRLMRPGSGKGRTLPACAPQVPSTPQGTSRPAVAPHAATGRPTWPNTRTRQPSPQVHGGRLDAVRRRLGPVTWWLSGRYRAVCQRTQFSYEMGTVSHHQR